MIKKIIQIIVISIFLFTSLIPLSSGFIGNNYYYDENFKIETIKCDLPDYFNWKDHDGYDWTTPAKNQGSCGSCWIFATVGVLESCYKICENDPNLDIDLSEQYALSCLPGATNNTGCEGGSTSKLFEYIFSNSSDGNYHNGIIPESCFPYTANQDTPCENKCENWVEQLIPIYDWGLSSRGGFNRIPEIKRTIMEMGPITAKILATEDFSNWLSTSHNPNDFYPFDERVEEYNHYIVLVGWKDDSSIGNGGYWICKNSWGDTFGYDGFFNIEYDALYVGFGHMHWVSMSKPDLDCYGDLTWTDIKPGHSISGNFTVENIGKFGSLLDWEIIEWPDWGEWTFSSNSEIDITPYDGPITVKVTIVVPDIEEQEFSGHIKIVNINDYEDYKILDISLTTHKYKENRFSFINWFIELFNIYKN